MNAGLLDNITWHTLSGPQSHWSVGGDTARRYAPGFSPIVGFADLQRPDFAALAPHCASGEPLYCAGWSGPAPAGWRIEAESTMHQMVWDGPAPPPADADDPPEPALPPGTERLGAAHVPRMLALVGLTQPGPFGPRTVELGAYYGCLDGERLRAMAGERMGAGGFREISGVCTHPDDRGHGLAHRLMARLLRQQLARGEQPFLHVMHDNRAASHVYERLGFRLRREMVVRVLSRVGA